MISPHKASELYDEYWKHILMNTMIYQIQREKNREQI